MTVERDRTTVRRALRAGAVAGAVVGGALLVAVLAGPGGATAATVMGGVAVAALVAAGWLLLAAALDLLAGDPPGLRRVAWTAAATVLALLGPFLVLGTLGGSSG